MSARIEARWQRIRQELSIHLGGHEAGMAVVVVVGRWEAVGQTFSDLLALTVPEARAVRTLDLGADREADPYAADGEAVTLIRGFEALTSAQRRDIVTSLNTRRGLIDRRDLQLVLWLEPGTLRDFDVHGADLLDWRTALFELPDEPVDLPAKTSWLRWPVKIDLRGLLKAAVKAGVKVARGNVIGVIEDAVAAAQAVQVIEPARRKAATLVGRSLGQAVLDLIDDHRSHLGPIPEADPPALDAQALMVDLVLDTDFFERPQSLPALAEIKPGLTAWLRAHGRRDDPRGLWQEPRRAETIAERLGPYYAAALAREYRKHADDYAPIWEAIQSPVTGIEQRARDWRRYRAWLMRQPHQPLFADSFSLMQVYQRLRAWRFERIKDSEGDDDALEDYLLDSPRRAPPRRGEPKARRLVVDAMDAINGWLDAADKRDALRVISGGPGAGKSSLAKVIAARRAAVGERALLIELHHFEIGDDLETAVNRFGRKVGLRHDVFEHPDAGPLLLIFDGLDELSIRGSVGKDAVLRLVERVSGLLKDHNRDIQRARALLLGREVMVQGLGSQFKRWQRLTLLPYLVSDDDKKGLSDHAGRLAADQRDGWWAAYAACTGRDYDKLPDVLKRGRIGELTAEPLLNYLVAIALDRGRVDFSNPETTLTDIYDDLVRQVFDRVHASADPETKTARLKPLEKVDFGDYHAFLRAIAVTAWHGEGRTAAMSSIEARVGEGLLRKMDLLRHGSEEAISRLVAAFYFREHADSYRADPTYEFTHQSFAEYLVAGEIVAFLDDLLAETQAYEANSRRGWSLERRLTAWALFFGPASIERNVFEFLHDALRSLHKRDSARVRAYQVLIGDLISGVLGDDFPTAGLPAGIRISHALKHVRYAGRALLMVASACARLTEEFTPIAHPGAGAFGSWLGRLRGQRVEHRTPEVHKHLVWLPLSEISLLSSDLFGAELFGADLREANLRRVDLFGADLRRADLRKANLISAFLQGAYLQEARLRWADLQGVDLQGAYLEGADLQGANLRGAHLRGAHPRAADLRRADLFGADLRGTDLRRADLRGARLRGAHLCRANLKAANLQGADLRSADLRGAYLVQVDLRGADLRGALYDSETVLARGLEPKARGMERV